MWSLFKGVSDSPLLRRIWFQCLCVSVSVLAMIHVGMGMHRFYAYQDEVGVCVSEKLRSFNDAIAKEVKLENFDVVASQLAGIEFSCAKVSYDSFDLTIGNQPQEYVNFYWRVETKDVERLLLGKNLLKGPISSFQYPLSIWNNGIDGEDWVGRVSVDLYYGEFLNQVTSSLWRIFLGTGLVVFVLSVFTFYWVHIKLIVPNRRFEQFVRSGHSSSSSLRQLLSQRDDELSGLWRVFLEAQESNEVERFEFEAQVRDLESHISKIERGQVGQSISTEKASAVLKASLSRVLLHTDFNKLHSATGLNTADNAPQTFGKDDLSSYLGAVLAVVSNLHERAKIESGEIELSDVQFNLKMLIAQIITEYTPRFAARHVDFQFHVADQVPDFVRGDPEKLKRVMKNAFKRVLLDPYRGAVTFKVFGREVSQSSGRIVFQLNTSANRLLAVDHDSEKVRDDLLVAPTSMLEMLCYLLGARWTFNAGPEGNIQQSLSLNFIECIPLPSMTMEADVKVGLESACVVLFDQQSKPQSLLYRELNDYAGRLEHISSEALLYESISSFSSTYEKVDVFVISDVMGAHKLDDTISYSRRYLPSETIIAVVLERPQIGDSKHFAELGVNIFLAKDDFSQFGIELIRMALHELATSGSSLQLLTKYSSLDAQEVPSSYLLPETWLPSPSYSMLLISEELINIEYVRECCKQRNIRLVHTSSALGSVDTFKCELFDLIVVDDIVEDVDSFTVIQMLRKIESRREDNHSSTIFALSELEYDDGSDLFSRIGTSEVIYKPLFTSRFKHFLDLYVR